MSETVERDAAYAEWLGTRPESVQKVGAVVKPWVWYVMRHDNLDDATDSYDFAVYRLYSISEDGTVTVAKYERWFGGASLHSVFGVKPEDLRALPADFDFDKWATDFDYNIGTEG